MAVNSDTKSGSDSHLLSDEIEQIALLFEKTSRAIYDKKGPHNMHPGQWSVLRFMAAAKDALRDVNGVAAHLGVTPGPASRAIAALEAKGLLIAHINPDDRRKRTMTITAKGIDLLEQDPIRRLEVALTQLDQDEIDMLDDCLRVLHMALKPKAAG